MNRYWLIGWSTCMLFSTGVLAQINPARIAQNRLQAAKWESAYRLLKKSLRKDSVSIENQVVLTQWFLASGNPGYQVDSADYYLHKATRLFNKTSIRERERLQRFPVDSAVLQTTRYRIDSLAFEEAKRINTEATYIRYLARYPTAHQVPLAIELRDEVSFLSAMKLNTYSAFYEYLQKYPNAVRAADAKARYEKLLFEDKTKEKTLAAYRSFVSQYPTSPYTEYVHQQIFEIMTASGQPEALLRYMREFATTRFAKQARNFLFHLYKEWDEQLPGGVLTDSLRNVQQIEQQFWVPFFKNGLFGFINQQGHEVLPARFDDVEEEYKCEGVRDDVLSLKEGWFSRTGKKLAPPTAVLTTIGSGFLQLTTGECATLIHKSGAPIVSDCHERFAIAGDSFVVGYKNKQANLFTLAGRPLSIAGLTDVREIEDVLVITRLGKKILVTATQVAALADGQPLDETLVFDDVQPLAKGLLRVRNGVLEGVMNAHLKFVIPLDRHTLVQTPYALLQIKPTGTRIHGLTPELNAIEWHRVSHHQQWLVLTREGRQQLYNVPGRKMVATQADSIWFDQRLAFVQTDRKVQVWVSPARAIELPPDSRIKFIAARDSVQFFYTESRNKRTVFTIATGEQLFTTELELIESIGTRNFVVAKANKKGLTDRQGKIVVPVELETLVLNPEGQLSLLLNRKFGLYDLTLQKLIKPEYERNLVMLNTQYLVAFKDGKYGLIGWDTKPVTPFEYDEVVPWQGEEIWVKQSGQWILFNFKSREVLQDRIRSFSWLARTPDEKIVRLQRENFYGVLSSKRGMVIPPTFHQVINLGTAQTPFYLTEKQVEEAGMYILIYYDASGKLVRRQAVEEDEYDRLMCEEWR
ncbi:MAG: WG repeat-containing protein [Cyclobacteriaceae bacterium]|nr:WG repeat-containing protein [Cyclobacteriaceae bacterium]